MGGGGTIRVYIYFFVICEDRRHDRVWFDMFDIGELPEDAELHANIRQPVALPSQEDGESTINEKYGYFFNYTGIISSEK